MAVAIAVVVLANPEASFTELIVWLAAALLADGLRTLLAGGMAPDWWRRIEGSYLEQMAWVRRVGRIGLGILAVGIVAGVLVFPQLRQLTLLYLLAFGVVLVSLDRIAGALGTEAPEWLRASALGAGALAILLIILATLAPEVGLVTFVILLAVTLLLSGIQSVIAGLHPTDPRQIVLLKVVLFSLLYGLVLINWIDLFGKSVPAYGVWLILTYFAPFTVMLVYEGFSEWPLALSLGLLVSLANDVGYFFVGNLLFGFHTNLPPWILGQLGFQGNQIVTTFEGGSFAIDVTSWMMGLSIYLRAVVVSVGLYYWWSHPSRIVARLPDPPA
ncbi:MAG TPA: hypothetical protein VGV89_08635 [Thermoplasmata archaeon]|nr:hypothetical protein [Thermoplasmata archaeon]